MKDYLNSLAKINESIEQIQSIETTSKELNLTATNLAENIQPCLEEIKTALSGLEKSLKPCYQTLAEANDTWESKAKICEISSLAIIEQLGKLTAKEARIKKIATSQKAEIIDIVLKFWKNESETIRNHYFKWDEKTNKFKTNHLKFFQKHGLFNSLNESINQIGVLISKELTEKLQLIYEQTNILSNSIFHSCLKRLNQINQQKVRERFSEIQSNIDKHFKNPTKYLPDYYRGDYIKTLIEPINNLNEQSSLTNIFRLYIEMFNDFCLRVEKIAENLIVNIVDQKVNIALEAVNEMINFYNEYLENQARYQDELISQHKIEKAWIDEQQQELDKIQEQITAILQNFLNLSK